VSATRSPYSYVAGNPINRVDPGGLVDKSYLSAGQINRSRTVARLGSTRASVHKRPFCAESTFGIGSLAGGDCRTIAGIAANDYKVVKDARAKAGRCDDVTLLGGDVASTMRRSATRPKPRLHSKPPRQALTGPTPTTAAGRLRR
jgi:hypothetical protein